MQARRSSEWAIAAEAFMNNAGYRGSDGFVALG